MSQIIKSLKITIESIIVFILVLHKCECLWKTK